MPSEPALPEVVVKALANREIELEFLANTEATLAAANVEVLTASDYGDLVVRSELGVGLAQISARLLQQLSSGEERAPAIVWAGSERDKGGNRVPWDDSPLVAWKRVIVRTAGGSMVALMSVPRG